MTTLPELLPLTCEQAAALRRDRPYLRRSIDTVVGELNMIERVLRHTCEHDEHDESCSVCELYCRVIRALYEIEDMAGDVDSRLSKGSLALS